MSVGNLYCVHSAHKLGGLAHDSQELFWIFGRSESISGAYIVTEILVTVLS